MVKSFPGVRTKECIRNNKKDIYFSIRYTRNGKQYEESIGYKSDGFTAAQAYEILSELKRDIKTGKALSLREKTEQREQEKIANEAANIKFGTDRHEIEDLMASVFGTIQPQRLIDTVLSDRGDGFNARFLWVYPDPVAPAIPSNRALPTAATKALQKLDTLLNPYDNHAKEQKKCLLLSTEAKECFFCLVHKTQN